MANLVGVSMRYTVDGGSVQTAPVSTANPTGNAGWQWYNVTISGLTAGSHTIQLQGGTSGQFAVIGIEGRNYTTGTIIHRCAVPGMILPDLLASCTDATDTVGAFRTKTATEKAQQVYSVTKLLSPNLVLMMVDVNDLIRGWGTYSWGLADVKRHLTNALNSLKTLSLPVLVVLGPWLRDGYQATGCPFSQDELSSAYREVVQASTNASLIDIRTPLWSRQGYSNDMMDYFVHPTALGANFLGAQIADAMIEAAYWV